MTWDTSLVSLFNVASAVVLVALGSWVASRRPVRGANLAFALLTLGIAVQVSANNLVNDIPTPDTDWTLVRNSELVEAAGWLAGAAGAVGLMWTLPGRGASGRARWAAVPLAVYGLATVVVLIGFALSYAALNESSTSWGRSVIPEPVLAAQAEVAGFDVAGWARGASSGVAAAAHWTLLTAFAVRYDASRRAGRDGTARESALMAAGLAPYFGLSFGIFLVFLAVAPTGYAWTWGPYLVGVGALVFVSWAVVWASAGRGQRRAPVTVLGLFAAGVAIPLTTYGFDETAFDVTNNLFGGFEWGVSRVVGLSILGYAVVRHQAFGIDVKVKWTLKQSTVAAIFIAVFFVVSELAAAAFSERLGTFAGIVAAGALVFAIVPLQHVGQRLADKAMPGVKGVGEMDDEERHHAYLEAARQAWADGAVDKSERAMLDRMGAALGIGAEDAQRLEREAAR